MVKELAEDLSARGHEATVITGFPNYPSGIVFDGYKKKLFKIEQYGRIKVIRCFLFTSPNRTIFSRIMNYLSFAATSMLAAAKLRSDYILFVISPPISNGIIALILNKLKKVPYVFNIQDIYPDAAISMGIIKNHVLISALRKIESHIYKKASGVSVISGGFRRNLIEKRVPDSKIVIIPNWLDTDDIMPKPRYNSFSDDHGLNDKFIVLYSGTIGMISGAKIILQCAERLAGNQSILFLFVGDGVIKAALQEDSKRMKLNNVRFLPFQPRERLSEVQSSADVSVVTLLKGKGGTSVPSKVLGYMAASKPVVASVDMGSDTWELIQSAQCGICTQPEDVTELADAILALYHNRVEGERLGRNGRAYLVNNYHRRTVTARYERLLAECEKDRL
jgi:colanic acid biosynthesis glycosyl transferase WcaI